MHTLHFSEVITTEDVKMVKAGAPPAIANDQPTSTTNSETVSVFSMCILHASIVYSDLWIALSASFYSLYLNYNYIFSVCRWI